MATVYKIHPAIGIARVGNSAEFYLAPETPGGLPLDPTTGQPIYAGPGAPRQNIFHDAAGAVKKQAARFKVFAYDNTNPNDPGVRVEVGNTTVGGKKVTGIEWTVYLANKKAAWFEFRQLTGSGQEGDAGYLKNNAANPGNGNPNLPFNPLRSNKALALSSAPNTINDAKRKQLILDPGPRTVSGANAAPQDFKITSKGLQPFDIVTLGRVLTDSDSNLIVLGGNGSSGTTDEVKIGSYANNDGWFDDVSDGPITGRLVLEDGSKVAIDVPSWVLCGPPGYAPEIFNLVTLYDTMYDVLVRNFGLNPALFQNGAFQPNYQPNLAAEVTPIVIRPNLYRYVAAIPGFGRNAHAGLPNKPPAQFPLSRVRGPGDINTANRMPVLAGDNPSIDQFTISSYLTLTATQFFILQQYKAGKASNAAPPVLGEAVALDIANLKNCVGGAFCPGIEMNWISRNTTIYMPLPANPSLSDAFRLRHKTLTGGLTLDNGANHDYSQGLEPGDVIKYMAQPWQADFNECSNQTIDGENNWWWPAQRPYTVFPAANTGLQLQWTRESDSDASEFPDLQMVTCWKDLGFILNVGPAGNPSPVEIERNQNAISAYQPPPGPAIA